MCTATMPHPEDSQDLRRAQYEHDEIEALIRARRDTRVPFVYAMTAATMGSAALLLWGVIGAVAISSPAAPQTRAFSAVVAFSAVLGVAACVSAFVYVSERADRRRAAESDRIRDYQDNRQVRVIREAIGVFLNDGDAAARDFMAETQQIVNGRGGDVRQFRRPGR
ncbi:hypothetical protein AB0K35_27565 [Micromonospora sp. NPDC053740]|uniref:hypothetical protein n=1 Tax=Micromonospora sp. NPDC053740 TaxID=3155173 RepID=UPI0034375B1A